MLLQFSVENFLSFDEEQVFSMVASTGDQMHPNHVVDGKGGPALRAAAIYGPNASGKSNLVEAIGFAKELIVNGTRRSQSIPVRPFKLRADGYERPSKFEFSFRTQGLLYNYGFRVTSERVTEEWLFASGIKKTEVKLFERSTSEDGQAEVEVGTSLADGARKQFFEFLAQGTRANQLLLCEAVERNVVELTRVAEWFTEVLAVIPAEPRAESLAGLVHYYPQLRGYLTDFLRSSGTDIEMVGTVETQLGAVDMVPDIRDRETVIALLEKLPPVGFVSTSGPVFTKDRAGRASQIDMVFTHRGSDSTFTMNEESDGTQRLVHLAPILRELSEKTARVVVIDELDRSFHPHLSRLFLQTALDGCPPDSSNQLIFTTHDTNLLDLDLLRRDEIWFVEKNKAGASHVYSLAEFKIRPDLKVEKGYLNGRFGAIPFITPIERLGWKSDDPATDDKAAA